MYTVLYVDDEESLLEVGKLFLEGDGRFSVDIITSSPAALSLMEKKNYDAIISDYQMPEMDGIEFLKRVRNAGNQIPFILFTGRGREEVVIQALNEGADFYLQKGGDTVPQFAELAHKVRLAVEQRRAESSIRDHERREQEIINFLPDATFAIDMNGTVIAWNRAIEEMTGVPAGQMLGKGNYEYALPFYGERRPILINLLFATDDEIRNRYSDIVRDGTMLTAETTLPRPRGEQRTLWAKASPLYDMDGNVVGAIEAIRDITGRKTAETELRKSHDELEERVNQRTADLYAANMQLHKEVETRKHIATALQESEKRYRSIVDRDYRFILDTIRDAVYRTDTDGILTLVNRSGATLLGYSGTEAMIGTAFMKYFADPPQAEQLRAVLKKEDSVSDMKITLKRKDGSLITVLMSSHACYDTAGKFAATEGIIREI
jgi:PAS domain S-box-containing protein